jgi:hypothetical protein
MNDLNRLARTVQALLTVTADRLAHETGFVKRKRLVTGSNWAQTLVFTWLADPDASSSRLQATAAGVGLSIRRQSLEARFTRQAAEFLKQLLAAATTAMVHAPVVIPLFERFAAVEVLDSSIVALPDELAAVHSGGRSGTTKGAKAATKLTVGLDLKSGVLRGPELADGRTGDLASAVAQADPPRGSLQLADLNYFSLEKFARWGLAGAYWLSRLKVHTAVFDAQGHRLDLLKVLRAAGRRDLDLDVSLGGEERLACRLIARRVPAAVAKTRRQRLRDDARRRNEPVSELALALADWTIMVTNVPRDLLSVEEAEALARMRWQIELVFKLWKSHNGIDEWVGAQSDRALCTVYGKLLAVVVQHWMIITGCWNQVDRSPMKAARVVQSMATSLAVAIRSLERLLWLLGHTVQMMQLACRMEHHQRSPNAHDRILCYGAAP